jgi:hypothetical protein
MLIPKIKHLHANIIFPQKKKITQTWKCHSEILCIDILNVQKCLFSKMKDGKVKQVLSGDWYQWEGGGHTERVKEGKYGGNTNTHTCTHV